MYNRSEDGIEGFKTYAKKKDLDESAYKVVEDLLEIGKTCVPMQFLVQLWRWLWTR